MTATIAVLDYGSGNLHSVSRALARVGGLPAVTGEPTDVMAADALVIPGVGHFGSCMRAIRERGLDEAIHSFHATGRPMFGVCVGMQVLFDGSEESPETGLSIVGGKVRRLPDTVKVPHMGWNTVAWARHPFVDAVEDDTRFYFVHSFAPLREDSTIGVTLYGTRFAAAIARDNVFATQFHPEKSGDAGLAIYERFVEAAA